MSIQIKKKNISSKLAELMINPELTEKQKELWRNYIVFLDGDQVESLNKILESDSNAFDVLTKKLETKESNNS